MESYIDGILVEQANAMPAPTWGFLGMNETRIAVPDRLAIDSEMTMEGDAIVCSAQVEFARALDAAQADWERDHPAPTAKEIADLMQYRAAEADATYGGTARSAYQENADLVEEARSLISAFKTGLGDNAQALVAEAAGQTMFIGTEPGMDAKASVHISGHPGAFRAAAIDIVAAEGSSLAVTLVMEGGPTAAQACGGATGTGLRIFAGKHARVDINRIQALGDGMVDIDDMGIFAAEGARVSISQTVLGGAETFTGLCCDLRGDDARIDIRTNYLGTGDQKHDFNYIVRHHGKRTQCTIDADGVLAGTSSKTLRGTIDLIRGAKGAQGTENETVLLVDEGVRNKTIPVILCNEDDVAGNHGATIGHIRDEQLFYLASRGIDKAAAESMLVGAFLEQAALQAPDWDAQDAILKRADQVVPGISDLFREDD